MNTGLRRFSKKKTNTMKTNRSLLLIASALVMVCLLGGGLVVKVGAAESSYRQAVLFAEILSQVLDNYVDPVEADGLLEGAYEGMLGSLDPNGAYLTAAEVSAWKNPGDPSRSDPGISVLKSGHSIQVVAVAAESPAEDAGVRVGDHLRSVDGVLFRDLSLQQARRMIAGETGTVVRIELLHTEDGFRREALELVRTSRQSAPYELRVERGTAILRIHDLRELPLEEIAKELDDVRSRPVDRLLLDLRNLALGGPRDGARAAALFTDRGRLSLRDRSGRVVDTVESEQGLSAWTGPLFVLVNGATAEGGEALALIVREGTEVRVFGETTFGLGAETKLFELQNGAGLLLSSELWETSEGSTWHARGVEPDEEIEGEGRDFADSSADQLKRVLEILDAPASTEAERDAA